MFWVFCNTCFLRPGQGGSKRQFFITSCSHILCSQCTDQCATVCRRCQAPCMVVQLNSQMPDEVKEIFIDVNEKIPQLMKVLEYQENNRHKLMSHYRNVFHKYNAAKVYVNDLEKKFKTLLQKYESCKMAVIRLQGHIDTLSKKYQLCKQKLSGAAPMTPSMTKSPHITPRQSPLIKQSLTPRNPFAYRNENGLKTPDSSASSHRIHSSASSLSSHGIPRFTPTTPTKSMELLSLLNNSRKSPRYC